MVTLHLAHTSPINPPNATPVLSPAQIWAGLQRKIRFAQEFVPVIESCEVLEEKDGVVTREVVFKKGMGPKDRAKEVVRGFWPSWVDFEQEDGSHIKNIISDGADGGLYMTYAFEFRLPGVQEGSEQAEKEVQRLKGVSAYSFPVSHRLRKESHSRGRVQTNGFHRWRRRLLRAVSMRLGRWSRMGGSRSRCFPKARSLGNHNIHFAWVYEAAVGESKIGQNHTLLRLTSMSGDTRRVFRFPYTTHSNLTSSLPNSRLFLFLQKLNLRNLNLLAPLGSQPQLQSHQTSEAMSRHSHTLLDGSFSATARQSPVKNAIIEVGPSLTQYHLPASLLSHYSEYFKNALNGPWKESNGAPIKLEDVSPVAFSLFVNWLYRQRLPGWDYHWVAETEKEAVDTFECVKQNQAQLPKMMLYVFADRFMGPRRTLHEPAPSFRPR
jgi:hypothetical protein